MSKMFSGDLDPKGLPSEKELESLRALLEKLAKIKKWLSETFQPAYNKFKTASKELGKNWQGSRTALGYEQASQNYQSAAMELNQLWEKFYNSDLQFLNFDAANIQLFPNYTKLANSNTNVAKDVAKLKLQNFEFPKFKLSEYQEKLTRLQSSVDLFLRQFQPKK